MPGEQESSSNNSNQRITMALDLRVVIGILLLIIVAMLLLWRPWNAGTGDRTISVTGEATVQAEADEYMFTPSYQFKNADPKTALDQLTQKSAEVVAELKALGVEEKNIKTNSNGFDFPISREPNSNEVTYTLTITATVSSRDLAQQVQNYLLTTSPVGAVSPQPTFSDAKRKELETQARDQATQDARTKAEQSAKNLGFRLGHVKEVSDGSGFGVSQGRAAPDIAEDVAKQLAIQPGQNELHYTVTVIYFVR